MKSYKSLIFYLLVISGCSILIYYIFNQGNDLTSKGISLVPQKLKGFTDSLIANVHHPFAILLAQMIAILIVARFFGWICTKIHQPTVMGEIVAGITLGPSLFGMYFGDASAFLFPPDSLRNLQLLSQIGLILFMFIIGMEVDLKMLKNKAKDVVVISHASIIFPFTLGMSLAYFIYESLAPAGVKFSSFALFIGISMSITAFPVLARILQERGIQKSRLGALVLTCAAADDVTGWCLLAAVIAIVNGDSLMNSIYILGMVLLYVLLMVKVLKPLLKRLETSHASKQSLSKPVMALFFMILLFSSISTEIMGIHALFGAFMAGVIMPANMNFRNNVIDKIQDVTTVFLLPLFFVFTGLRTEIGLLNTPVLWALTGLVILVAITGKFAGSALSARFMGQNWKDSLSIGILMNTRGLMELIVLNIGYDLGIISPAIFTMFVIMALVTTFMTGPALDIINIIFKKSGAQEGEVVPPVVNQVYPANP